MWHMIGSPYRANWETRCDSTLIVIMSGYTVDI